MPQIDIDGANSKISADKIQGQSGTTVTVPTGHTVAITDVDKLTIAGTAVKAGALGKIVQVVNVINSAVATGTTVMTFGDSIPQNTAGDEYMTLAITPTSASNKLFIQATAMVRTTTLGSFVIALFQDTTANALGASAKTLTATYVNQVNLIHYMTAGTTSATTFKIRMGNTNSNTTTFNGSTGSRQLGGIASSNITITEIAA